MRFQTGSMQTTPPNNVPFCDFQTYGVRYPALMDRFADDLAKYEEHYKTQGVLEGLLCASDLKVWNAMAYARRYGIVGDTRQAWMHYVLYGRKAGYSSVGDMINLGDQPVATKNGKRIVASVGPVSLDLTRTLHTLRNRRPPAQKRVRFVPQTALFCS